MNSSLFPPQKKHVYALVQKSILASLDSFHFHNSAKGELFYYSLLVIGSNSLLLISKSDILLVCYLVIISEGDFDQTYQSDVRDPGSSLLSSYFKSELLRLYIWHILNKN